MQLKKAKHKVGDQSTSPTFFMVYSLCKIKQSSLKETLLFPLFWV